MKLVASIWFHNGKKLKVQFRFPKTHRNEVAKWITTTERRFENKVNTPGLTITVGHTLIQLDNIAAMELKIK